MKSCAAGKSKAVKEVKEAAAKIKSDTKPESKKPVKKTAGKPPEAKKKASK